MCVWGIFTFLHVWGMCKSHDYTLGRGCMLHHIWGICRVSYFTPGQGPWAVRWSRSWSLLFGYQCKQFFRICNPQLTADFPGSDVVLLTRILFIELLPPCSPSLILRGLPFLFSRWRVRRAVPFIVYLHRSWLGAHMSAPIPSSPCIDTLTAIWLIPHPHPSCASRCNSSNTSSHAFVALLP